MLSKLTGNVGSGPCSCTVVLEAIGTFEFALLAI